MKMKKLLSIFLSALLLLSLFACGAEDTEPKDNNTPDIPVDDEKPGDEKPGDEKPKDNNVSFESGRLPTMADTFYEGLTIDNYYKRKDEIQNLIVDVVETREQCEALIHPKYYEFLQENANSQPLLDEIKAVYSAIDKYTEDFLSEKQVIAISYIGKHPYGDVPVVKELTQNEDGTYHLVIAMDYYSTVAHVDEVPCFTVTIEVDKSLGITPENLTVEFVQGNPLD